MSTPTFDELLADPELQKKEMEKLEVQIRGQNPEMFDLMETFITALHS